MMASIDKIYVTKKQFIILERWYKIMVEYKLIDTKLIPFNQYNLELESWEDGDRPVWNLSVEADMWLLVHCPFDFVKEGIMFNYNLKEGDDE